MNTLLYSGLSLDVPLIPISVLVGLCSCEPEVEAITTTGNVAKRQGGIDNIAAVGSRCWAVSSKNGLALETSEPTH